MSNKINCNPQQITNCSASLFEKQQPLSLLEYFKKYLPEIACNPKDTLDISFDNLEKYGLGTEADLALICSGLDRLETLERMINSCEALIAINQTDDPYRAKIEPAINCIDKYLELGDFNRDDIISIRDLSDLHVRRLEELKALKTCLPDFSYNALRRDPTLCNPRLEELKQCLKALKNLEKEKLVEEIKFYTCQHNMKMLWEIFKSRGFPSLRALGNAGINGLDFNRLDETFPSYLPEKETYIYYLSDEILEIVFSILNDPKLVSFICRRFRNFVLAEYSVKQLLTPLCARLSRAMDVSAGKAVTSCLLDPPPLHFECTPQVLLTILQRNKQAGIYKLMRIGHDQIIQRVRAGEHINNPFALLSRLQNEVAQSLRIAQVHGMMAKHDSIKAALDRLESQILTYTLAYEIDWSDMKDPIYQALAMLRAQNFCAITNYDYAHKIMSSSCEYGYLGIIQEVLERNLLSGITNKKHLATIFESCVFYALQGKCAATSEALLTLICAYGHRINGHERASSLELFFHYLGMYCAGKTDMMYKLLNRVDETIISKDTLFHIFCNGALACEGEKEFKMVKQLILHAVFQDIPPQMLNNYIYHCDREFTQILIKTCKTEEERIRILNKALLHATKYIMRKDREYLTCLLNLKSIDKLDAIFFIEVIIRTKHWFSDVGSLLFEKMNETHERELEARGFFFHLCHYATNQYEMDPVNAKNYTEAYFFEMLSFGVGVQDLIKQRSSCELLIRAYIKALQEGRKELAPHEENYKTYLAPADLQNVQAIDFLTSDIAPETKVTMLENLLAHFYKQWGIPAVELSQNK